MRQLHNTHAARLHGQLCPAMMVLVPRHGLTLMQDDPLGPRLIR